jgi:hypothetical protein
MHDRHYTHPAVGSYHVDHVGAPRVDVEVAQRLLQLVCIETSIQQRTQANTDRQTDRQEWQQQQ